MNKEKKSPKLIKICRASGMPVELAHIEAYKADWQTLYDKVLRHVGMHDVATLNQITKEQNERANRLLSRIERMLLRRYPNTSTTPFLKSERAWTKLVLKYDAPIAVARAEAGGLAYIILDVPIN